MFWQEITRELAKLWAPETLARILTKLVFIILIIAGAYLVHRLTGALLNQFLRGKPRTPQAGKNRTVITLIRSILMYVIALTALVMVLRQLGVNYTAILAGAGVVGLAVGFGAQTLIRDFISGFFILFEGLIQVGDYIKVGDTEGTVEQVGLRTTQFRSFNGMLHTIPNGELTRFGNFNRDFCRALVDIEVPYRGRSREIMALFHKVATAWAAEKKDVVLEPPSVFGILGFGEAGARIRVVVKVKPQTHWEAERELRLLLKEALDDARIGIPAAQREVRISNPESVHIRP